MSIHDPEERVTKALAPDALVLRMATSLTNRLRKSDVWVHALGAGVSVDPAITRVQRLDKEDELYFIVTAKRNGREPTARFALDGATGHLLEAAAIAKPRGALSTFCDPMAVIASRHRSTEAPAATRIELIGRHPTLVWKPCRQSTSRLLPFWQLTVRDSLVYVRVDGQIFGRLVTTGRG